MELAAPFEMTQPAVSRHLQVLERAGIIVRRAQGTRRPCRLSGEGLAAIDQWLSPLRAGLSRTYERLDALLTAIEARQR